LDWGDIPFWLGKLFILVGEKVYLGSGKCGFQKKIAISNGNMLTFNGLQL